MFAWHTPTPDGVYIYSAADGSGGVFRFSAAALEAGLRALLRRRLGEGMSAAAIAVEVGRTPGAVGAMAKRAGLRLSRQSAAHRWPAECTAALKRRWAQGVPGKQIAEELSVSAASVFGKVTHERPGMRYNRRNGGRDASAVRNTLGALCPEHHAHKLQAPNLFLPCRKQYNSGRPRLC